MYNLDLITKILSRKTIISLLHTISLICLIPILDFVLVLKLGEEIGYFFLLGVIILLSGLGIIICKSIILKTFDIIEEKKSRNVFPKTEYYSFSAMLPITFLFVMPGFISTFIALILLISRVRVKFGIWFSRKIHLEWNKIYEYFSILD